MTSSRPQNRLVIRAAVEADADALHAGLLGIARAAGSQVAITSTPDDLRRHGFGKHAAFEALIAEVGGAFAGMCIFFPSFSTWKGRPGVYVQDLYVADEYRGQGIGERLLARVASLTRERGGVYLRLSVETDNEAAQAFYERVGVPRSPREQVHAAYGEQFLQLSLKGDNKG